MQKNFGSVVDMVSAGENVRITRHGRPAFLLIPDTSDAEEILRELAARKLAHLLQQAQPTPAAQTLTQDIDRLIAAPAELPIHAGRGGLADGLDGLSNQALYVAAEHDA
jgi:antitoxin (DNA-binding transcriptional repressor) of toxin-antitoxin stability system